MNVISFFSLENKHKHQFQRQVSNNQTISACPSSNNPPPPPQGRDNPSFCYYCDLISIIWKMLSSLHHTCMNTDWFFTLFRNSLLHGYEFYFRGPFLKSNLRKFFFIHRVVQVWNSLLASIVAASSTRDFKSLVMKINLSKYFHIVTWSIISSVFCILRFHVFSCIYKYKLGVQVFFVFVFYTCHNKIHFSIIFCLRSLRVYIWMYIQF